MNIPGLHKKVVLAHTNHGNVSRTYWVKDAEPTKPHLAGSETLRFSSGERQRVKDPGVHPENSIKISYGLLFSRDANRGVDAAIKAIGQVHTVPKDLFRVPVKVTGSLGGAGGMYWLDRPEINVSKWAGGPAGIVAHEYGHFLDHNLFGNGKPGFKGLGTLNRSPELKGLMNAIYRSDAVKQIAGRHKEFTAKGHERGIACAEYLLMPPELFARGYAQWVGLRTGGAVRRDTQEFGEGWRRGSNLHAQWDDKDFEPIAREFDRLFANRGLLRQTRARSRA